MILTYAREMQDFLFFDGILVLENQYKIKSFLSQNFEIAVQYDSDE
jgi:hypothetical protein